MKVPTVTPSAILPKVNFLRQRISNAIQLSLEKAAAHINAPNKYPLPAGKESLEYAIADLVKDLPKRRRDKFLDKMNAALTANAAARQQKYGDLSKVDLLKGISVAEQVKAIAVPENMRITEADMAGIKLPVKPIAKTKVAPAGAIVPGRQPQQAVPATVLQFAIENITCVETNDRRKDEAVFSALVTDSTGALQEKNNFFAADFKEGDSKSPGAAGNLFDISLEDSSVGGFPVSFAAGVFILEKGLFRGDDSAEKIGSILRLVGKLIATASLGTLFIPSAGLPLSLAIVGVGAIITIIGDIMLFGGDAVSQVISDELVLEAPPLVGETFARTLEIGFLEDGFIKPGKYAVAVRWTVA
jgi:hypothetical protein